MANNGIRDGKDAVYEEPADHADGVEEVEDRKRKNTEPDDVPHVKKANTNTMFSMTKKHRQILEQSGPDILRDLDASDVVPHLLADGVITSKDAATIDAKEIREDKVKALLDIIPRRADRAYGSFLDSLKKTEGSLHLYDCVKRWEKAYKERDVYEESETKRDGEPSMNTGQASGSGITDTQGNINLSIFASENANVQNNTLTGQSNVVHK